MLSNVTIFFHPHLQDSPVFCSESLIVLHIRLSSQRIIKPLSPTLYLLARHVNVTNYVFRTRFLLFQKTRRKRAENSGNIQKSYGKCCHHILWKMGWGKRTFVSQRKFLVNYDENQEQFVEKPRKIWISQKKRETSALRTKILCCEIVR